MLSPRAYIEIYSNSPTTFGPLTLKAVIHDALNVGWGWYSRFPANAFFTLRQESIHNADLVPGLDHVRIWFHDPATGYGPILVFNGRLADPDESGEDVVWQAWGYLAELSLSLSGFRRLYPNKKLGSEIVSKEWSEDSTDWPDYGAKVQNSSLLNHIATGTIENPQSGGVDITTDTRFGVVKVPRLLLFFDMTEMGRANTTNNVTYEISRSTTPTFNFWKNSGNALTARRITFPGNVKDFRFVPGTVDVRNVLSTVGTALTGTATAIEKSVAAGAYGYTLFGRREDVFTVKTLAGINNADTEFAAQERVTERAVNEATQLTSQLQVDMRWPLFLPFDGWEIEDTIRVQLKRGRTNIDADYRIIGVRARMDGSGYNQALYIQPPTV